MKITATSGNSEHGAAFQFYGAMLHLDPSTLAVGRDLWEGLRSEEGEGRALQILEERIQAASSIFGLPSSPPPTPEQIYSKEPAGTVLVSSLAALLAAGISAHP